ncbi:hypothetical protein [Haloarcula marina]|uniref:hypothetical protein n=1 Tax=Haloarcula marina TaxID=2961574 RepID=UPI0020B817F6|nr:hypothetical protein [Halomicroarcula marina]
MGKMGSFYRIYKEQTISDALSSTATYLVSRFLTAVPRYYALQKRYHMLVSTTDVEHYSSPVDPYKIVRIPAGDIDKMTRRDIPVRDGFSNFGSVVGGDWDIKEAIGYNPSLSEDMRWCFDLIHDVTLEKTELYRSFRDHFVHGTNWEDTRYVSELADGIARGRDCWYDTQSELLREHRKYDLLYHEVAENGLCCQRQYRNEPFPKSMRREVRIDIGRDGEPLLAEGRHRVVIAKLLGVDVPVVVMVRHPEWTAYRDAVYEFDLNVSHPDFSEFGASRNDATA